MKNQASATGQRIQEAEAGKLYEVGYTDPHHGEKGLVAMNDEAEYPQLFFLTPGTGVHLSKFPFKIPAPGAPDREELISNVFAISDENGFVVDEYGRVDFNDLEIGVEVFVRGRPALE